jgi:hypothetical protein
LRPAETHAVKKGRSPGADAEVIEPEELRREIREEIEKMAKIYPPG